jgi:hypothetical protein
VCHRGQSTYKYFYTLITTVLLLLPVYDNVNSALLSAMPREILPYDKGYPVEGEGAIDGNGHGQPVQHRGQDGIVAPTLCWLTLILQNKRFKTQASI